MGGPRKKLESWAGYEYGPNPVFASEGLTGACRPCVAAHVEKLKKSPPCHRCPKYLLYPRSGLRTVGLRPDNEFAVHLYRLAATADIRAGDGAYLQGTVTPEGIGRVLDEHADHFPTAQARRETYNLIWLLNAVATERRRAMEDLARKRAMEKSRQEEELKRRRAGRR